MRHALLILLLSTSPLAVCQSHLHSEDESGAESCAAGKLRAFPVAPAAEGGIAGAPVDGTDVEHYFLDLEIVPASDFLSGSCTMTVRVTDPQLSTFRFRLDDAFTISTLTLNGLNATWARLNPIDVLVTFDQPLVQNDVFELTVAYSGVPQGFGLGSIVFSNRGGTRVFYTLSEPWYAYTWWPQKDDNRDKATGTLRYTVPGNYLVASNGLLTSQEDLHGSRRRYTWETAYPTTPYLFAMAGANYQTFESTWTHAGGVMPLQFFIYPDSNTTPNRNAWLNSGAMLTVFSTWYGLYPFVDEKYGIYQFGFSGGMEHQTMTGQGTFSESVTAHEVAHQWWGDMITCEGWEDIWLNEGFATYSEAIWYEKRPGGGQTALRSAMNNRRPNSVNGTVYIENPTDVNRIFSTSFSYRKAAWVLHMLRHVVGDTTFFSILSTYRAAYEFETASTADFIAVCEAVHGQDLDWFFQPWLFQPGAPEYEYASRAAAVGPKNYLEVYIRQIQPAAQPAFTMPIDLLIATSLTTTTTRIVWNNAREQHFLIALDQPPLGMGLDVNEWILTTGKQDVPFVEGPPKIIETLPAAGSGTVEVSEARVTFHKDIVAAAGDVTVLDGDNQPVGFLQSYDSASRTLRLNFGDALPVGQYTLTVHDHVRDAAASLALDGENPTGPGAALLPSGNGLPGGDFEMQFSVTNPPLTGDLNCDGLLNNFDIDPFVLLLIDQGAWQAAYPLCNYLSGDINLDHVVDNFDIDPFVALVLD